MVTGADTGVPLVSREASTAGKPVILNITLWDRGKRNKWAGWLGKPGRQCLMPESLWGWNKPKVTGVSVTPTHWGLPPRPGFKAAEVKLGKGFGVAVEKAGPTTICPWGPPFRRGREVRKEPGHADPPRNRERLAASQASWLQGAWEAHIPFTPSPLPCCRWLWEAGLSGISPLPVVRLRPVRVLGEAEAKARGRVKALESAIGQVSFEKSSCT